MSRYIVNKFLYEVDGSDELLASFRADRVSFVDWWQGLAQDPEPPHPRGGVLSPEEARAIVNLDFGLLYAHGAHPFLLWQFARSVSVPDLMTIGELIASFREEVAPHGIVDFST